MAIDEFSVPEHVNKKLKDLGYTIDTNMETHIHSWFDWYSGDDEWYKVPFNDLEGRKRTRDRLSIRPAKRVAAEWASLLVTDDTTVTVEKEKANDWLQDFLQAANFWPTGQLIVEKAFALAWQNLHPAFEGSGEARGNMLLASNLAGMAFNAAGLGLCHSLAHALGGRFHVPHGRLNALIFPHVLAFNAAGGRTAARYGQLARLCGLSASPRSLAAGWNRLRARLGLPQRLGECGVETGQLQAGLEALVEAALADLCAPSNPRAASPEDVRILLRGLA